MIILNRIANKDRDERVNHIISKCSKLAQKEYKTRHDWVGKVIYWVLNKILKFDHTTKWYLHKPVSDVENETHGILLDFEIQIDHLIPARKPELVLINKKKRICQPDNRVKIKESEKIDIFGSC